MLVPVVGEVIRQIGPCFLASRPQFDDLMDGLTFGVISGVAYATFDTLVRHSDKLFGGMTDTGDPGFWVSLIFLEGLVKPLIMGTATGIACAEFSGLGKGYDGFSPRYFRGLAEAVLANVAYGAGTYLFSFLNPTMGVMLSIVWGLIILAILILRVRTVLHAGLMEAALERSARDGGIGETGELGFCAQLRDAVVGRRFLLQRLRYRGSGSDEGCAGSRSPSGFLGSRPADGAGPAAAEGSRDALSPSTSTAVREPSPTALGEEPFDQDSVGAEPQQSYDAAVLRPAALRAAADSPTTSRPNIRRGRRLSEQTPTSREEFRGQGGAE